MSSLPHLDAQQAREDRERAMLGRTAKSLDVVLDSMSPREIAMYAMGTLSNAQELIRGDTFEDKPEWSVRDRDANTLRQLINIAKYAIDKVVPR